jgi:taurine dioxygenase
MTAIDTSVRPAVRQLAGRIGAELTGIDAATPLDDHTVSFVREALLKHRVVFLRDQALDYASEVRFAERFGSLTLGHPTIASPADQPLLEAIDSKLGGPANQWHTDVTFVDRPPAFTFLHGVVIPAVGGDTIWANTVAAYQALPTELQDLADTLRVVHTNVYDYAAPHSRAEAADPLLTKRRAEFTRTLYRAEHPAVRVHPETGERSLVLGGFASTIVGLGPQASRDLIRIFQDYITRPENTVRWQWRVGDIAIWDNRATQHIAVFDYGNAHRRGERVTVAGPPTVGIDGRTSIQLEGDATTYYADAG